MCSDKMSRPSNKSQKSSSRWNAQQLYEVNKPDPNVETNEQGEDAHIYTGVGENNEQFTVVIPSRKSSKLHSKRSGWSQEESQRSSARIQEEKAWIAAKFNSGMVSNWSNRSSIVQADNADPIQNAYTGPEHEESLHD